MRKFGPFMSLSLIILLSLLIFSGCSGVSKTETGSNAVSSEEPTISTEVSSAPINQKLLIQVLKMTPMLYL